MSPSVVRASGRYCHVHTKAHWQDAYKIPHHMVQGIYFLNECMPEIYTSLYIFTAFGGQCNNNLLLKLFDARKLQGHYTYRGIEGELEDPRALAAVAAAVAAAAVAAAAAAVAAARACGAQAVTVRKKDWEEIALAFIDHDNNLPPVFFCSPRLGWPRQTS